CPPSPAPRSLLQSTELHPQSLEQWRTGFDALAAQRLLQIGQNRLPGLVVGARPDNQLVDGRARPRELNRARYPSLGRRRQRSDQIGQSLLGAVGHRTRPLDGGRRPILPSVSEPAANVAAAAASSA